MRLARIQRHRHQYTEEAAVKGHATLPHGQYLERMKKVKTRLVEQHLPQAAAEDDAEHAVKEQVVELLQRPAGAHQLRMRLDAPFAEPPELEEGEQVHQTVPADGQRAERNGDGVELGMNQHGCDTERKP